ncbi:MAG: hypothetical protein GY739_20075, partial [Mesoflavibacter sp.]|nr:hypothetical protein [Mesoflavibacter sp.]
SSSKYYVAQVTVAGVPTFVAGPGDGFGPTGLGPGGAAAPTRIATHPSLALGADLVVEYSIVLALSVESDEVVEPSLSVHWQSHPDSTYHVERNYTNAAPVGGQPDVNIQTAAVAVSTTTDGSTANDRLTVGSTVTIEVVVTVPEGTLSNAVVDVDFSAADMLSVVRVDSITPSSGDVTVVSSDFATVLSGVTVGSPSTGVSVSLGTLENRNLDNTVPETVTLIVVAYGQSDLGNVAADSVVITAELTASAISAGEVTDTATMHTVEPDLTFEMTPLSVTRDAGDYVNYTVTVTNGNGGFVGTGFNLELFDDTLSSSKYYVAQVTVAGVPTFVAGPGDGFGPTGLGPGGAAAPTRIATHPS